MLPSTRNVIIIGAGIAGLAAAIYARLQGHEVTVVEKCPNPGGVSTSWKRKGYNFEGGIHWLIGSSTRMKRFNRMWHEVGALQDNNPLRYKDPIFTVMDGGRTLELRRDLKRLRADLLEAAPEDARRIKLLCTDIELFMAGFGSHDGTLRGMLRKWLLSGPFGIRLVSLLFVSTRRYISHFRSRLVQDLLRGVLNEDHNALSLIYTIASYCMGDSGYPEGGSLRMAENMASRLLELGGTIRYRSTVGRVEVADGAVKGVQCEGDFLPATDVVVATDTRRAIDRLFDAPLGERWARRLRRGLVSEQCMFICLGVRADLSARPVAMRLRLPEPLEAAGLKYNLLWINNYSTFEGYAPQGCSALTVFMHGESYDFWKARREDGTYAEAKNAVVEKVVATLAELLPETAGKVEVTDMATPLTYERYCDSFDGGWMTVWKAGTVPALIPARSRSIRGLYFAGHRTQLSGGLPIALDSGYRAARAIR